MTIAQHVITHNSRIGITKDNNLSSWKLHIRQVKENDGGCYACVLNTDPMKQILSCIDVQGKFIYIQYKTSYYNII